MPVRYEQWLVVICYNRKTVSSYQTAKAVKIQVPPSQTDAVRTGADIYGKYDGAAAYLRYYNQPHHLKTYGPNGFYDIKSGRTLTYGAAAKFFGFSFSATTIHDVVHVQQWTAGKKTSPTREHEVWTSWDWSKPPPLHRVLYSS
jgi:hypothetical protein